MANHIVGTNFFLEISRNSFSKYFTTHRNAYATSIGTNERIVWPLSSTQDRPYISSQSVLDIVSSSASDTSAGTGARTLLVEGLDGSFNLVSETVTLNGTSIVQTVNQYFRINRLLVVTAGSSLTNVGRIDAKIGATIHEVVSIGRGRSESAVFTTAINQRAYITNLSASTNAILGNRSVTVNAYFINGSKFIVHTIIMTDQSFSQIFPSTPQLPPGFTIEFRRIMSGTATGVDCALSFDLIVEDINA